MAEEGIYFRLICPLYNGRAQFEQLPSDYDEDGEGSLFNLTEHYKSSTFPESVNFINLPFCPASTLPLSDILTASFMNEAEGLICNNKFLDLLNKFKLPEHKIYPFSFVRSGKTNRDYQYIFFRKQEIGKETDFSKSTFSEVHFAKMKEVTFEDYEDFFQYNQSLSEGKYIKVKQLKINPASGSLNYDLISTGFYKSSIYMSAEMKAEYDKAGLSGLRFKKECFL